MESTETPVPIYKKHRAKRLNDSAQQNIAKKN